MTGPLYVAVDTFRSGHPGLLTVVSYEENRGLGHALTSGLPECCNEIVARMDSDDYAFPTRMEKQLGVLLGGYLDMDSQVTEFVTAPDEPIAESTLPCDSKDIETYSKKRNPFRHPTMVFRKSRVLQAGNYSGEYLYFEDWDLFNRMIAGGCRTRNINEPLVAMRVSPDFYARRGGPKCLPHIWRFKVALESYEANRGRRTDRVEQARQRGFDIKQVAMELCDFYSSHGSFPSQIATDNRMRGLA